MVEIINLRKCRDWGKPGDVLIDRRSKWGNPFPIGAKFGNRDQVCDHYELWLKEQVKKGRLDIADLKGAKRLGCWCFGEGTLVITKRGYIPIENVTTDDWVLSHDSQYHMVTQTTKFENMQTIKVKFQGIPEPIVCTKNHEFYVRKKLRIQYKGKRDIVATSPNWIPAKDLKKGQNTPHSMGMLGGYPLDMPSKNDQYNLAFWYLVGRYLGDGWLVSYIHPSGYIKKDGTQSNKKSWITCICTSKQDADRLSQKIIKSGFKFNRTEMKTETTFRICNKAFTIFLEQFGKYSHGKFIPEWCFSLPYNKQKVLLQGIIDADGHFETKKNRVTVTSVSKLLSLGIARLFRNVYKNRVSICKKNSIGRVGKIGNRVIQAKHNSFVISTPINSGISTNDNCVWMAFRYITQGEKTAVYNISVDGSESFIVNGIAVHNCKPLACHGDILKKYIESGGLDEQEK